MGKQDQYAAAFGGLNNFVFNKDGSVDVKNLGSVSKHSELFASLFLVWTAMMRDAETVLSDQVAKTEKNFENLIKMTATADSLAKQLETQSLDPKLIGRMLLDSWNLKKSLSEKISNSKIDTLMDQCIEIGCTGGKLLGAGGGGFLLMQVADQIRFTDELKTEILVPVIADQLGSRIILKV
jgi:D-glycero-alpha-D-manno-heptose-7-phosphate kinase